jgi:hypothetical protein
MVPAMTDDALRILAVDDEESITDLLGRRSARSPTAVRIS